MRAGRSNSVRNSGNRVTCAPRLVGSAAQGDVRVCDSVGLGLVGFVFVDGFLCAECLEQRDRIDKLALELAYCAPPALIALRAVLYRVAPFYW